MAELDRLKEEVGHYKVWEGAGIAFLAGLSGWLVTTGTTAPPLAIGLATAGVILMGLGLVRISRQIGRRIERIGKVKPWKR